MTDAEIDVLVKEIAAATAGFLVGILFNVPPLSWLAELVCYLSSLPIMAIEKLGYAMFVGCRATWRALRRAYLRMARPDRLV